MVTALVAAGCSPADSEPAARPSLTYRTGLAVQVGLFQYRDDQVPRILEVKTRVVGAGPVQVLSVALDSGLFAPAPADDRVTHLDPGQSVDLKVALGAARCDQDPARIPAPATLLGTADGVYRVAADAGSAQALAEIHGRECAVQHVQEQIDVHWGTGFVRDGDRVLGTLVLDRRTARGPVRLEEVGGGINFTVAARQALPSVLPASDPSLVVPVEMTATRCEPHAMIESKRRYRLPVRVAVDDGASVLFEVVPGPEAVTLLEKLLDDCLRALVAASPAS